MLLVFDLHYAAQIISACFLSALCPKFGSVQGKDNSDVPRRFF